MQTPKVYVPAISPISHRGSSEAQSIMVPTVSLITATISISNSYRWNIMNIMLLHNWVSPYIHVHTHIYTCTYTHMCTYRTHVFIMSWFHSQTDFSVCLLIFYFHQWRSISFFWCPIWPHISLISAVALGRILNTSQTQCVVTYIPSLYGLIQQANNIMAFTVGDFEAFSPVEQCSLQDKLHLFWNIYHYHHHHIIISCTITVWNVSKPVNKCLFVCLFLTAMIHDWHSQC